MTDPFFTHALVRRVSRSLADCELTHLPRQRIDVALAAQQHAAYLEVLRATGISITVLPEEPSLPDAVFVEDMAVMLDEFIVVCRPGRASRQPEVESIAPVLFAKARLPNPSHWQDNPRKPVERVRWRDAKQYCNERSLLEKLKPCYNENKESPPLDPTGPPNPGKDVKRVMRGGSWKASADMCRATLRQGERTGDSDACFFTDYCGFRCVRRAAPEELQQLRSNMRKIAP